MAEPITGLGDATRSGLFQLGADPAHVARVARAEGLVVRRIVIARASDKRRLLAALANTLALPAHFGHNWDALHDCLTDSEVVKGPTVIVLERCLAFATAHPAEFEVMKEVLAGAAEYWRAAGRPFWVFVHDADAWDSGLERWPAVPATEPNQA